jgi:cytochrome c peroxidase
MDNLSSRYYGKFRIPALRNIAVTGPYMSNGVFKELRTVLEFYNHISGNNTATLNPETNQIWENPEVNGTINHALLKMELLSEEEMQAIEAFLRTLLTKNVKAF